MWDVKKSIHLMGAAGLGFLSCPTEDPRVASWMLDPGAKEQNIYNLVGIMNLNIVLVKWLDVGFLVYR